MSSTSHLHDDDSPNPSGSSIPPSLRNWFSIQSAIPDSAQNCRSTSPSLDSSSDDTSSRCRTPSQGRKKRCVGVRQRKSGKWVAEIREKSRKTRHWLGTFNTEEEAARAYDAEAKRIRGPNTRLNFPSQSSQNQGSELYSIDHEREQHFQNNQTNEEPGTPETGQIHDFTELITHLELNNEYRQEEQFQDHIYEQIFQLSPLSDSNSCCGQSRTFNPFADLGGDPVFHFQ